MKKKKVCPKDFDRALAVCEAAGMTKRQSAFAILDFLADRGALGPTLCAEVKRLVREAVLEFNS